MFKPTPYLPDPFMKNDGSRVDTPEAWPDQAAFIRRLAETHYYGTWPGPPSYVTAALESQSALFGRAVRETGALTIDGQYPVSVDYLHPSQGPFPVIVYNATRFGMRSCVEKDIVQAGYGIFAFDREMIRPDPSMARGLGYEVPEGCSLC